MKTTSWTSSSSIPALPKDFRRAATGDTLMRLCEVWSVETGDPMAEEPELQGRLRTAMLEWAESE